MTYARFGLLLAIFTGIAALLATAAHYYLDISYALPFTLGSMLLLFTLSVGLFFFGKRTVDSDNKFLFSNVFMGGTMVKFFACGGIIAAYIFLGEPQNKLFVVPFFTSYLVFTLLEVVALIKMAGQGKKVAKKA